jgi:protein SCO1/2
MRRCVEGLFAAALIAAVGAARAAALDEREAIRASQAVIGQPVPALTLTDSAGRALTFERLRGKPLLVSFIYTGCFQVCPTQTRALREAVQGLDKVLGSHQFNVVSIGFNQPFDSPPALRAFAAQHGVREPNWIFASPRAADVEALTRSFGFSYVATPAGFDHVLGVTVVDAEGRIRAQVLGDRLRADQLGEPLRRLVREAPLASAFSVADVIERVRVLCTVYDPETGRYRYDWKLIFELFGGAAFFATVAVHLLLDRRRRPPAA